MRGRRPVRRWSHGTPASAVAGKVRATGRSTVAPECCCCSCSRSRRVERAGSEGPQKLLSGPRSHSTQQVRLASQQAINPAADAAIATPCVVSGLRRRPRRSPPLLLLPWFALSLPLACPSYLAALCLVACADHSSALLSQLGRSEWGGQVGLTLELSPFASSFRGLPWPS